MWTLVRALTYAALFIGLVLVFLPAQLLPRDLSPPPHDGVWILGIVVTVAGAALAIWCVLAFAIVGRGTPAIFDPPRQLVARGPYRWVRNPMYIGATLAVAGAAIVYRSPPLALYAGGFLMVAHAFVLIYEEPTLRRKFGAEYDAYCARVPRWLPKW
jgi:protein-S-isoprenylcysteine O-methyltransferase Ste14